jgi:hypothetical protein
MLANEFSQPTKVIVFAPISITQLEKRVTSFPPLPAIDITPKFLERKRGYDKIKIIFIDSAV